MFSVFVLVGRRERSRAILQDIYAKFPKSILLVRLIIDYSEYLRFVAERV
jgi:hypothetical protein